MITCESVSKKRCSGALLPNVRLQWVPSAATSDKGSAFEKVLASQHSWLSYKTHSPRSFSCGIREAIVVVVEVLLEARVPLDGNQGDKMVVEMVLAAEELCSSFLASAIPGENLRVVLRRT